MKTIQLFQRQWETQIKASYSPNAHYKNYKGNIYENIIEIEDDIFSILFLSGDIVEQERIIHNLANNK